MDMLSPAPPCPFLPVFPVVSLALSLPRPLLSHGAAIPLPQQELGIISSSAVTRGETGRTAPALSLRWSKSSHTP